MKTVAIIILLCLSIPTSLFAGTISVDPLTGTAGLGGGITGGYEFQVTDTNGIIVDGLGYWDDQSNGFVLGQTFPVGLWQTNGTLLASTVITSSSTLTPSALSSGGWRVNAITPIFLAPGFYRLGGLLPDTAANATIGDPATYQVAPGINLVRFLRHIDGTTLTMPDIAPPYPEAVFLAPAFTFRSSVTNPATLFTFTSSASSYIGGGQSYSSTNVSASRTFSLGAYTDSVHFGSGGLYNVDLVGPNMTLAHVGYYPGATRWPFMGSGPGLNFDSPGFGKGDNTLSGWFNVLQADYTTNGDIAAFAVDFVQYDETIVAKWNRVSIRYNSSVPVPGPAPAMQLNNLVLTNGPVQLTLVGPADTQCVIQVSSDLVTWVPLVTNSFSPVGLLSISDPNGAGVDRRFYRAVSTTGGGGGGGSGSNDQFANRIQIPSAGATVTGSNMIATKEPGEPNHGNYPGGKSVWWTWTAPVSGLVTMSLDGSSFDTTLGVYEGTAVNALTSIAQDDEGGAGSCSRVIFSAIAGHTYQIAVDGYYGASGNIVLTVKQGVLNDNFANRLQLIGSFDQVIGNNVGAGYEFGEPYHWNNPPTGYESVWWTWQAPASGYVTISTLGSDFDTIMAAYTGNSYATLSLVANNDDYYPYATSQITFYATAGTVYQIAVDGYGVAMGNILLTLQQ